MFHDTPNRGLTVAKESDGISLKNDNEKNQFGFIIQQGDIR
jgi:hypothetical protein